MMVIRFKQAGPYKQAVVTKGLTVLSIVHVLYFSQVPVCKVIRFNIEYTIHWFEEEPIEVRFYQLWNLNLLTVEAILVDSLVFWTLV